MSPRSTLSALVTAFLLLALLPGHVSAQAEKGIQFGGTYANLKPAQRALVDEWFRQFNEYPCVNLNAGEGKKKVRNWAEGRRRILDGMKNVSDIIGRKNDVAEAMRSIAPSHPVLKLVSHPQEQAYALVSVPDEIASAFECQSQAQGGKMPKNPVGPLVYGNYYGAIFELKVRGAPAALKLLWGKEKDQWKVIAYSVEVP